MNQIHDEVLDQGSATDSVSKPACATAAADRELELPLVAYPHRTRQEDLAAAPGKLET